jgi:hypothetical protein
MVAINPERYLEPGEVNLTEKEAESRWAQNHPDYSGETQGKAAEGGNLTRNIERTSGTASEGSPPKKGYVSWAICSACQAIIMQPNARFCPNCGADLSSGAKGETLLDLHGQGEKCIVCRATFRNGDIALSALTASASHIRRI